MALIAAALTVGGVSAADLVLLPPVAGGMVGDLLLRRWATRPGEL